MVKKAVQRGRSEQRGDAYSWPYVEPLRDAKTTLADFFNILLSGADSECTSFAPKPGGLTATANQSAPTETQDGSAPESYTRNGHR
jgi:hypothetical protein